MSTDPIDLADVEARAARHALLERDAPRDITLAEVSAAIASADDVPALVAEVRRLRDHDARLRAQVGEGIARAIEARARTSYQTRGPAYRDAAAIARVYATGGDHG